MIGIVESPEPHDRDTGHPLQHFGDAVIGQHARFIGDDRIDDRFGIFLALGRSLERLAAAGHEHFLKFAVAARVVRACGRCGCVASGGLPMGHACQCEHQRER
jgi:hypothetical protein